MPPKTALEEKIATNKRSLSNKLEVQKIEGEAELKPPLEIVAFRNKTANGRTAIKEAALEEKTSEKVNTADKKFLPNKRLG